MSDQRDPRIRALIVALSEASPEAPTFAEVEDAAIKPIGDGNVRPLATAQRTRGWPIGAVAAASLIVLVLIGGPLLLLRGDTDIDIEPLPPVDVETTAPPPTSISSTTSTGSPVVPTTTATPLIGPVDGFEWEVHELSEAVTYPALWRDGYVALRGDWVVSSADGIRWEAWPEQPGELADRHEAELALAVDDGEVVLVVAEPGAPLRAFASNGDEPWHEIPIQPGRQTNSGTTLDLITNAGDGLYVQLGETYSESDGEYSQLGETYIRLGDSFVAMPLPEDLTYFPNWYPYTRPARSWTGITPPEGIRAIGEKDGRFTAFTWPGSGEPWTSNDGTTWRSIEPVAAPFNATDCGPSQPSITPQVVETGGLGWFAAGSYCAPTVVWYSPDGTNWQAIDNIEGLSGFDIWVPFPPIIVVDDHQVLIYGNVDDGWNGRPDWAVWVGTPQSND